MNWAEHAVELVWIGGLAGIPVALAAAAICRWRSCRPATRHMLWLAVLLTFAMPALTAGLWRPDWFRSERVIAAADSVMDRLEVQPDRTPFSLERSTVRPIITPIAEHTRSAVVHREPASRHAPSINATCEETPKVDPAAVQALVSLLNTVTQNPVAAVTEPRHTGSLAATSAPAPTPAATVSSSPLSVTTAVPAASSAPASRSWGEQARAWVGHLTTARDAIAAIPPVPPLVWLVGAAIAALLCIGRTVWMARSLRRAAPAPEPLQHMVSRLARVAGLRRAPLTLVTEERISPMVWCGVRPRLVLPLALWRELDADSQRAVIVHELSHLKRGDHRLCWLEALIGIVYWWHPVAWWARRRLRDEAETCCDAWVTTLMPGGRRAYAEALLATKSFLCLPGRSGAPGLAVMSGRTKQLARRLTMVMTQRTAPRSSIAGMAVAMGIALAGMIVMPGLACPPEDEKPQKTGQQAGEAKRATEEAARARRQAEKAAEHAARAHTQAQAQAERAKARAEKTAKAQAEKTAKAQNGQAFFGEAPALEAMRSAQGGGASSGGDVDQMTKALKEKEQNLKQMEKRLNDMQRTLERLNRDEPAPGAAAPSRAGSRNAPRAMTTGPGVAIVGPGTVNVAPSVPHTLAGRGRLTTTLPAPAVASVAAPTEARSYKLPAGKLEALQDLMARDDVPVMIQRGDDEITVHATPEQHKVFAAFVKMIHPEAARGSGGRAAPAQVQSLYGTLAPSAQNNVAADAYRKALRELTTSRRATERQSEQIRRQFDRYRERAEELESESDDENADPVSSTNRAATLDTLLAQMHSAEAQLDALDNVTDSLDEQIESLNDQLAALADLEVVVQPAEAVASMPVIVAPTPAVEAVPAAAPAPALAPTPAAKPARAAMPVTPAPPAPAAAPAMPAQPAPPATSPAPR